MRINDGGNRNAWREPEDGDVITRPQPAPQTPAPASEASAPAAPAPTTPFWAAGAPVPPSALDELPPAGVQAPPEAAAAAPASTIAPPPTALTAPPTPYTGEPPADPAWLGARETALIAVRSDYQGALAQAQTNPGSFGNVNPGWVPATLTTDESGRPISASNAALVNLSDPNAAEVITGWNEGSPVYGQPAGTLYEFNEAAFAAHYQAQAAKQPGSPLQALATLYDSPDATSLLAQHPELWHIATHDHALNAGPAKAGFAMGNPSQLGMSDLYLADPQINALVTAYGGSVAPATGSIALEQVRLYGQQRYDQLSRLGNAMQSVRDQYGSALTQAFTSNIGPGWTERARTVTFSDESGAQTTRPVYLTDESGGQPQTITDRVFDPDAFTAWYTQQPGLQNKAFGDFYGASHTQYASDESGRAVASSISFDNAHWSMGGVGSPMGHRELVGINPNDPPELNDNAAVGFDFEAGWATQRSNLHQDTDWFETAFKVVVIAAVAYFSAGTLGPAVAGSMGLSTAAAGATVTIADLTIGGMIVSAAVAGAATSLASGILNDNLSLKDVLRGALSGALTAGLMQGVSSVLGVTAANPFTTVGGIAARTTVQGAVQALMGGNFKDGAIAGLASGLAEATAGHLNAGIDQAVSNQTMTAAEGFAAHTFARVIGSAIRAAASPGDPGQAFASAFLDDVFRQVGPPGAPALASTTITTTAPTAPTTPTTPVAFDDDGFLMPGIVDPGASAEQQTAQLAAQLRRQGIPEAQANLMAQQALGNMVNGVAQLPSAWGSSPTAASGQASAGSATFLWKARTGYDVYATTTVNPVGTLRPFEGEQPSYPNRESLPVGAQLTALHDDAGGLFWRVVAEGYDGVVVQPDLEAVTQLAPVIVTGRRIPRSESTDLLGNALVIQGDAASLTTLAGTTLVATQAGEAFTLGEAASAGARVLVTLARLASMPATVLLALFTPTNATEQFVDLGNGERFRTRPGELYGELQQQTLDGRWLSVPGQIRLDQLQGRSMLSDEERDRIGAPLTNPMLPPAGPSVTTTPPLTDAQRELLERPTTTPADAQAATPLPGYAIAPSPTIDDLLIDKKKSEILGNNLEQAGQLRPGGYEAHHIVPSEAGDARMEALRAKLVGLGIDLNNAANGVWLPGPNAPEDAVEAYHRRLNNRDYNNAVADAFDRVTNQQAALTTLRDIKNQLQDGNFPGVRPRPKP